MREKLQKIRYIYGLCKKRAEEGHLSTFRQIMEIMWLQVTRGIGYSAYHFASMWDKNATWGYKISFLGQRNFVKKIHQINQRKFHGVTQHKPFEKAIFKLFNIPSADYVGVLNGTWGVTEQGHNLRTEDDLYDLLKSHVNEKICFKLLEGFDGNGFKAYEIIAKDGHIVACHLSSREDITINALFSALQEESFEGWLLEKYIVQHPTLRALNPSSLNTVRVYVLENKAGEICLLPAFLRIGCENSLVDNGAAGGTLCLINMETGALHKAYKFKPDLIGMSRHPDHGAQIEGVVIPYWQEAIELGKKMLAVLPGTRFAGFDISITPDGPVMIEVNIQPAPDGFYFMRTPTARVFDE